MAEPADDGYVSWYQGKLWRLAPGVYRNMDAVADGVPGPLQELLNRIGAQVATLRRSIDRLGENLSIETCDDWAIPYIGDLVATRLVSCLDAPAQRLQVAKTIYYRRRAGTLGLLEELVSDIALRDARAVEFFRRLGRTRHQFDPAIDNVFAVNADAWTAKTDYSPGDIVVNGANAYVCATGGESGAGLGPTGGGDGIVDGSLTWNFYEIAGALVPAVIQGLAGAISRTPAGGFADLRSTPAAALTDSSFDEFAHTADLRAGAQRVGRQNISHLGLFVWWLRTFRIAGATPVAGPLAAGAVSPCYTFDPSGRQVPLFVPKTDAKGAYQGDWVSPDPWDLPLRVSSALFSAYPDRFYPSAFDVALFAGATSAPTPRDQVNVFPEQGLFSFVAAPPAGTIVCDYGFALMSTAGAGAFPFSLIDASAAPATTRAVKDDATLAAALASINGDVAISIGNSQTYKGPAATLSVGAHKVALTAIEGQRPLLRWQAGGGVFTIDGAGGDLVLQGFWLQGADLKLTGHFDSVTLQLLTLDPGTSAAGSQMFGVAIDGLALAPSRLIVEAEIATLTVERCITGPILCQTPGVVQSLNASDSVIQAIATGGGGPDYALQTGLGAISLVRCTVIGACAVHRLDASDCILAGVTTAEDLQHGCVRFSALAKDSKLHSPFRCVTIDLDQPVFYTRHFGDPNYVRLSRLADAAILDPQPGDTILGGGSNGAEMGAWQSEGVTLKRLGLTLKFEEFAPLGVFPVWIDAD